MILYTKWYHGYMNINHSIILISSQTRSSNDRWEAAADIQTGEQYSSTGSINAQKHLATTVTSRITLIVFLKMPTLIEAEAAIALTCFSNDNLESIMTPKIFNSETISTTELSINKQCTTKVYAMSVICLLQYW